MRLRRLGLDCYGNFESLDLALDVEPGRINLVVAPNGAGKSVLRQAMAELLFGIHPQTPMGFQFDYNRMRLRAECLTPTGATVSFVRRKGRANTLMDAAGQPADAALSSLLPRESERKRLERLFVLDSAQLRAGGRSLLQTDGDLADALLSGAGDLGSARALAADLARRRDAAAPERKSARTPFYEACDAWSNAGTQLAATVIRPPALAEQEAVRAAAQAELEAAHARDADAAIARARLGRVRSTRRHFAALDAASDWLVAHPDAPLLARGVGAALATARDTAAAAGLAADAATQLHAGLAAQLAGVAVDEAVLAEAAAITALVADQARCEQSLKDIPKRESELAEARAATGRLLRELSSSRDPADAAAELRAAADIAAARTLIAEATAVATDRRTGTEAVERLRTACAEATDDLAALPPVAETAALRVAYDEAVADGDAARLADQAHQAQADAAARMTAALALVPGWRGEAAALQQAPMPASQTLARLDQALAQARTRAAAATEREAEAAQLVAVSRDRLAALTAARPLPDATAVAASRAHRDRGWALVYARLLGQPAPDAEAAFAPDLPLPLAFERAIAAADAVADRRADEMERLAHAAELRSTIADAEAALAGAVDRSIAAADAVANASAAWAAAVGSLELGAAASLAEAQAVRDARAAAIAATTESHMADVALARLTERQAAAAAALATAMGQAPEPLPRLIVVARHRLADAERTTGQRQSLARSLAGARRDLAKAEAALVAAETAEVAWAVRWQAVLERLGRPAGEAPAITGAVLDRLVALPSHVATADTLQTRLGEMRHQVDAFAAHCAAMAVRLDEPPGDPAGLVRRLAARLAAATAARTTRDTLAAQAEAAQSQSQDATSAAERATATLAAAIAATGGDTLAAAESRVALAAERSLHEDDRAAALLRLREDGEGLDLDTLRAETAATPAEAIAEQMRVAEAESDAARTAALDAAARIERAEGELRTLSAGQDASRAASDRQAAAAKLSRVLDDAMVQHLAAAMLEHALQEVEASSASNRLLLQIGDTFSRLTGGAYDRLSPADEDGESKEHGRLIAHEAGGGDKHIARLSEGTRDQLYLALRLVAVEEHVRQAPALPFLADDILQTFDDARARAAMAALVDVSRHVQVIVLTHHPHLIDVAEGLPVRVQQL